MGTHLLKLGYSLGTGMSPIGIMSPIGMAFALYQFLIPNSQFRNLGSEECPRLERMGTKGGVNMSDVKLTHMTTASG